MRGLLAVATLGIAIALALIVLLGILDPQRQAFVWLENMHLGADILQKVATAIALTIGGIFAWYRFIRGERDPRLQPSVVGKAAIREGVIYVVATATALNTGMVDVDLRGGRAAVEIYATRPKDDIFEYVGIAPVFEDHDNIQPGETIEDQVWFEVQYDGHVGVRLDLVIVRLDRTATPPAEVSYPTTNIVGLIEKDGRPFTESG